MITLHTFGEAFGLPDASPFVIKAHLLLKLSDLPYRTAPFAGGMNIGPKGKRPFIEDEGVTIADSTLIRFHIEKKYQKDFGENRSVRDQGLGWAIEKMCEEHLYFALVYFRWFYQDNFAKGPAHFFDRVPALLRPLVKKMAIRNVKKTLYFQGLGRHTEAEISQLACRDMDTLAVALGDQDWFGGTSPCVTDATAGAFLMSLLCDQLPCPPLAYAQTHTNLVAYAKRVREQFF